MGCCITVTVAPEFTKKPKSTVTPMGGDAVFEVEVSGEPEPEVTW